MPFWSNPLPKCGFVAWGVCRAQVDESGMWWKGRMEQLQPTRRRLRSSCIESTNCCVLLTVFECRQGVLCRTSSQRKLPNVICQCQQTKQSTQVCFIWTESNVSVRSASCGWFPFHSEKFCSAASAKQHVVSLLSLVNHITLCLFDNSAMSPTTTRTMGIRNDRTKTMMKRFSLTEQQLCSYSDRPPHSAVKPASHS